MLLPEILFTLYTLPESRDFCSPCINFQCQEIFARPVYPSGFERRLLTLFMLPVSRDFCSPCTCFQYQETFAHPVYASYVNIFCHSVYASSVNRLLLTLYMLGVSRGFCSFCICFQCQENFAPQLMRNVSYCDYMLYWPEAITYGVNTKSQKCIKIFVC